MALSDLLIDGPQDAPLTVALAHGAEPPMDSPFMVFFAQGLAVRGFRAVRFEFPYMVERRRTGKKRPPDRTPVLVEAWWRVIAHLGPRNLVIGGKSLGGRIASMVADEAGVKGLVCLGYPFHGPGREADARQLAHLENLSTPALILQGSRDSMGNSEDVPAYPLSPAVRLHWLADGDHGFKPRQASGLSEAENWADALQAASAFLTGL